MSKAAQRNILIRTLTAGHVPPADVWACVNQEQHYRYYQYLKVLTPGEAIRLALQVA